MTRRERMLVATAGILMGLLGVAMVAVAQFSDRDTAGQYKSRLAEIDKEDPEALYALAKWCYQNNLMEEAMEHALAAHEKVPEDVRPKYLIFAITQAHKAEEKEKTSQETGTAVATTTISDKQIQEVIELEGADVIRQFKTLQGILIARCGSAKCHSSENPGAPFVLIRQDAGSDKTAVQNFLAINRYLNREEPAKSPFLAAPLAGPPTHPTRAIRGEEDPVFEKIRAWIDSLKTESERLWERSATPEETPSSEEKPEETPPSEEK